MQKKITFNTDNFNKANSSRALWIFGLSEAVVASLIASDWIHEYVWLARSLPYANLIMSHVKLLFKEEVIGGDTITTIKASNEADVEVIQEQSPQP
jgi:hypothetical protein